MKRVLCMKNRLFLKVMMFFFEKIITIKWRSFILFSFNVICNLSCLLGNFGKLVKHKCYTYQTLLRRKSLLLRFFGLSILLSFSNRRLIYNICYFSSFNFSRSFSIFHLDQPGLVYICHGFPHIESRPQSYFLKKMCDYAYLFYVRFSKVRGSSQG